MKKKKIIISVLKIGVFVALLALCFVPLLNRESTGASASLLDQVIGDVNSYYSKIKGKHKRRVAVSDAFLNNNANLILKYKNSLGAIESKTNNHDIYVAAQGAVRDKDSEDGKNDRDVDSGIVNILVGYVNTKKRVDGYFKSAQANGSIRITDSNGRTWHYVAVEAPQKGNYEAAFSSNARAAKKRVEELILLYQVTGDVKYRTALIKEIVRASEWPNYWRSENQFIDTMEIAYAVSLGYDYAYNSLTPEERCTIENRLMVAILLYGAINYTSAVNSVNGNYNQVTHSVMGIIALTLLDSSNEGMIKVVSVNDANHMMRIKYPIKSYDKNSKTITYTYKDYYINENYPAMIGGETLFNTLRNRVSSSTKSFTLRTLYSAIIAETTDYLPKILRSSNMYIDGSYPEGKNYYMLGMKYFSYYLATLENSILMDDSDTNYYGILNFEGSTNNSRAMLRNIVLNPVYISSVSGESINYADATANTAKHADNVEDCLFYLANIISNRYNSRRIANVVYDYRIRTQHVDWGFYSIMWYDGSNDAKGRGIEYDAVFDTTIYHNDYVRSNLSKMGVSAFRDSYTDSNGTFVAMKGGRNTDNHVHLDLGSYVYYWNGTDWVTDTTKLQYGGAGYHIRDDLRWQYYATRAESHSTIVLNKPTTYNTTDHGKCLYPDQWINAKAPFTNFASSANAAYSVLNLTDAYNKTNNNAKNTTGISTNSNTIRRGIKLFDHKKYFLVQDQMTLAGSVKDFYSFININQSVTVTIPKDKGGKEALLTDAKGNKVRLVLKSNNSNVKFATSKEYSDSNGTSGVLNKHIITTGESGNTHVTLSKNLESGVINKNKIAVRLQNNTGKTISVKVGVFFIPERHGETVDQNMLRIRDLDEWYMPDTPDIKVFSGDKKISSGASIVGSAVIKISAPNKKKENEVIRYSLDDGKTWYKYDDSNSTDVSRRTISGRGERIVTVKAVLDDGFGIQGETAELKGLSFKIEASDGYVIDTYNVDEAKKYIDHVGLKTTPSRYKKYIKLGSGYSISLDLGGKSYVYTGSVTKIYKGNVLEAKYTNIVRGDINGDGQTSALDYVQVKNHIMSSKKINSDLLLRAADANRDGQLSSSDCTRMKNNIMNGVTAK